MTMQDEFRIDAAVVHRLLVERAPNWADLPVRRVTSSGTDNAIFRLGQRHALRLPKRPSARVLLGKELDWLPHFQGLSLEVPVLRFRGGADTGLDCEFGILDWIEGCIASPKNIGEPEVAARDLARFLKSLHGKDSAGAPLAGDANARRGVPLDELSASTLDAIEALGDEIDAKRARTIWQRAASARGPRALAWLHGDLKADNLVARNGALCGVIDWGLAAIGDPAADYAAAWSWVDPSARGVFRDMLGLDSEDWLRARGWALYGAVIALSYYRGGRNPSLCHQARLTLSRLGVLS